MFTGTINNLEHLELNPGPPHYRSTTLSAQLPGHTCSYTKQKTFKAHIADTKAQWTKGQGRCFCIFCPLSIDCIYIKISSLDLMSSPCKNMQRVSDMSLSEIFRQISFQVLLTEVFTKGSCK